jgi:hypothetical protein
VKVVFSLARKSRRRQVCTSPEHQVISTAQALPSIYILNNSHLSLLSTLFYPLICGLFTIFNLPLPLRHRISLLLLAHPPSRSLICPSPHRINLLLQPPRARTATVELPPPHTERSPPSWCAATEVPPHARTLDVGHR